MLLHKTKTALIATCLLLAAPALRSQVILSENFSAPTLDPAKWTVNTSCYPSGVAQPQNGECLLQDRAHLVSVAQFDPAQIGAYRVTCRWKWGGPGDNFQILVRSDGQPLCNHYGTTANGIELSTYEYAGAPWFGLGWRGTQLQLGPVTTAGPGGQVFPNTWYTAEIIDLGNKIKARVDGPNGQWYSMERDVLQDTTTQKHLSFHNREGGHQAFLDDVEVSAWTGWRQLQSPTAPPAIYGMGLVYDEVMSKALLFGGSGDGFGNSTTWTHDGVGWQALSPGQSPPSRFNFAMVHDHTRGENVLFGGWDNAARRNDTWIWSAGNWHQANPSGPIPAPRDNHCGAFDRTRGRFVIFSGIDDQSQNLNDTWEWDGTQWHLMPTPVHPPGRGYATMCFDEARGKIVLYGGYNQPNPTYFTDTWLWDGTTWTQANPTNNPGSRNAAHAGYDPRSNVVLLSGGATPSGAWLNDTWEWNGTDWTQIVYPTTPPGRWAAGAAFNRSLGHLLTFGGITSPGSSTPSAWINQTWVLERGSHLASYTPFGVGCALPGGTAPILGAPAGTRPILGTSATFVVTYQPPQNSITIPLVAVGFSNTVAMVSGGSYPLPFNLGILGWVGCQQLVSLDGLFVAAGPWGGPQAQTLPLAIPSSPQLAGISLFAQGMFLHGTGDVTVSNGLAAVLGY